MKSLDELVSEKIIEFVNFVLLKMVKTDFVIEKVSNLNADVIQKLKNKYGIEGIILDVDETIRKEMKHIPKCNQDWIDSIKGQIKIIILSNGVDKRIEQYFKEKGIDYIGFAHKPLKKNFLKACEKMNLSPDKVLVIGDSVISDIYGGKRNNMKTALVKQVDDEGR